MGTPNPTCSLFFCPEKQIWNLKTSKPKRQNGSSINLYFSPENSLKLKLNKDEQISVTIQAYPVSIRNKAGFQNCLSTIPYILVVPTSKLLGSYKFYCKRVTQLSDSCWRKEGNSAIAVHSPAGSSVQAKVICHAHQLYLHTGDKEYTTSHKPGFSSFAVKAILLVIC